MFVIGLTESAGFGQAVCFLNDTKDVLDICRQSRAEDKEIETIGTWLGQADFGQKYDSDILSIHCVTDEEAEKLAAFYNALPEFRKHYGMPGTR